MVKYRRIWMAASLVFLMLLGLGAGKPEAPPKNRSNIREINLEAYQFGFSPKVIEVAKGDTIRIR